MKVPVQDLVKLVREIALDEIKKQLPSLVKEALSERYINRLVSEAVRSGKKDGSLSSMLESEEDHIPEPGENPIQDEHPGIYHRDNPLLRRAPAPSEVVSKLLSKDNPLAFVFEGVQPIQHVPENAPPQAPVGDVAPSVESLAKAGLDFNKMKRLSMAMEKKASESKPMETANMKMRELEERRKALDVPVPNLK